MISQGIWTALVVTFAITLVASPMQAGPFDNVLRRMEDTVNRRTENMGEQAVNGVFDKTEDSVKCAAGDKECERRESAKQAEAPTVKPAATARCLATDVPCLQEAKRRNQTVEIVDESELDTIRCSMSDTNCMQRAKTLGKKVELID